MQNIVYADHQHKTTVELYISTCKQFVQDLSSKTKYNSYLDVLETIVEYHNGYGKGVRENNFYDWIMILPINISVMTNGYFAGLQNKKNTAIIRAYKVVLEQLLQEVVDKLDFLEPANE